MVVLAHLTLGIVPLRHGLSDARRAQATYASHGSSEFYRVAYISSY